jgi:hypothetical protein
MSIRNNGWEEEEEAPELTDGSLSTAKILVQICLAIFLFFFLMIRTAFSGLATRLTGRRSTEYLMEYTRE